MPRPPETRSGGPPGPPDHQSFSRRQAASAAPSITATAREELEAAIWAAFPRARAGQVDAVLAAADGYAAQVTDEAAARRHRAPGTSDGPTARLLAAEHRRVIEEALSGGEQ